MDNDRIIALESKLAYQEDYIQSLNESFYAMQKQIDQLELTCQILKDKLNAVQNQTDNEIVSNEKPPHY